MEKTLEFPDLLRLIDERSIAFRDAVASAPSLDLPVPTCPGWTLLDLVHHLGQGRRKWAAIVAAGPATAPPPKSEWESVPPAPGERHALLAWWAASTRELLDALREAGPDRGCWTWWSRSQSPQTSGAAARHQLQEIAVHTYDAQTTVGAPQPLPDEVALDGVEDFQFTCCSTTVPWPHKPAVIDYHATEARSWRLRLSGDGAQITRLPAPGTAAGATEASVPGTAAGATEASVPGTAAGATEASAPGTAAGATEASVPGTAAGADGADASAQGMAYASARGTASDLVLAFYNRIPLDSLKLDGDRHVLDQIVAWEPDA